MAQLVEVDGEFLIFLDLTPNWKDDVSVSRAYKTDIFTSFNGREQRRALRQTPRREISFNALLSHGDMRRINTVMAVWKGYKQVLMDPSRTARLFEALEPGQLFAHFETVPSWVVPEMLVTLEYKRVVAARRVRRVLGNEIEFYEADNELWPSGTRVHPAVVGRLTNGLKQRIFTNEVATAVVDFSIEPASETFAYPPTTNLVFDGMEVWGKKPNFASPLDLNQEAKAEFVDFDRGRTSSLEPYNFSWRVQKNLFLNRNAGDALDMEGFFHRMRGARGTFLAPTWTNDIELDPGEILVGGSYRMETAHGDTLDLLSGSDSHTRLVVILKSGLMIPNKVVGIGADISGYGNNYGFDYGGDGDNGSGIITFRDPWPRTITEGEISQVCGLMPVRFASDSLTITWRTDSVSEFQVATKSLLDSPYDPSTQDYGWGLNYGNNYGGL